MLRAIIVDDEILVRATLEKMVDWAAEGFQLAGCYANGQAALEAMERCPADLVFTDIKMPVCSGLEFIDGVHALGLAPHIVVLSAFDEFPLVKQAFKKGAADYVLKQEIVPARMLELVREARAALCAGGDAPAPAPGAAPLRDTNAILQDVIFHNALPGELPGLEQGYVVACFFLDEIYREMARLGTDVNATLTQPLTKLVMQMPQFRSTDGFYSFDMSRHFLFYSLAQPGRTVEKARTFLAQVQRAWKNYMNISCTVGMAAPHAEPETSFYTVLEQAETNTTLRYVLGPGRIYDESYYPQFDPVTALRQAKSCMPFIRAVMEADFANTTLRYVLGPGRIYDESYYPQFDPVTALRQAKSCMPFIRAVMEADFVQVEQYKNELVGYMQDLPLEQGQSLALLYLYNLYYEMGFYDMQVAYKLGLDHRLYQRLRAIETQRDLVIYFTSVLRRIMEYFESNYDQQFPDPVLRAKRFLDDSYMRADLTLGEVAQRSGYNEKYFCTLFKKRFDISYSDYLTGLRIAAARELLEKTNMRMYEVCDAVGYNSVEHFLRTFKRATGQTPLQYRKENVKKHQ